MDAAKGSGGFEGCGFFCSIGIGGFDLDGVGVGCGEGREVCCVG